MKSGSFENLSNSEYTVKIELRFAGELEIEICSVCVCVCFVLWERYGSGWYKFLHVGLNI